MNFSQKTEMNTMECTGLLFPLEVPVRNYLTLLRQLSMPKATEFQSRYKLYIQKHDESSSRGLF
jgi:hypothetical protein